MGTYYNISFLSEQPPADFQQQIDVLLASYNQSVSTYIPTSIISQVNQAPAKKAILVDSLFTVVFQKAKEIYTATDKHFDPTIMPLVNVWGFGYKEKKTDGIDSLKIDSLLQLVDFKKVKLIDSLGKAYVIKEKAGIQLDFSAIAKGHGVDLVGELLQKKGIKNYLVDIGGELIAKGKNSVGENWTIGIEKPKENLPNRAVEQIAQLNNQALATSGNYRNFYEKEGKKYVHIINPKTGYAMPSNLLSVSVFTKDCMTADAYATAFMVMGLAAAKKTAVANKNLAVLFIYSDDKGQLQTFATDNAPLINQQ